MAGADRIGAWARAGAVGLALALALLRADGAAADVHAGFSPSAITVSPGDTFTVELVLQQAGAELNAFDASVRFDPARVTFLATTPLASQRGEMMTSACANTFHRFDAAPDSLRISLSLLCSDTFVTGPGVFYRVRFVAGSTPGTTQVTLGGFTEFYRAGLFVRPLFTQSLTVNIVEGLGIGPTPPAHPLHLAPPAPNPRRGGGPVLLDFSLDQADVVAFELLDLQGRRLAERAGERFRPGRYRLTWATPALTSGDYFVRMRTGSGRSRVQRWTALR